MKFQALLLEKMEAGVSCEPAGLPEPDLMPGDMTVRVRYSSINYKDGLAITGKMPTVRRYPLIPGIDFAGTVIASDNPDFQVDDQVVLNGWGVGEQHHWGFSEVARVSGESRSYRRQSFGLISNHEI